MPLQPSEVKTEHIANNAVITSKIAPIAVTSALLASNSVITEKIADKAVTRAKIGDGQVTTTKLRDAGVTTPKLAAGAVTANKIADAAIGSGKLASGSVTAEKIANGAVTSPKIVDGAIGTTKLSLGSVTTERIANGAITPSKLSFTPPSVARPITPAVATDEIGALQITNSKLQDGCISAAKIAGGAVTPAKLSAIDSPADGETPTYNQAQAKFEWKAPSAVITRPISPQINTDEIADLQITNSKLQDGAVTTPKIGDLQITNSKLQDNAVTTPKIQDGAVTIAKMEDRFTIAQNVLLFSNLNNVPVSNTLIDCAPYVPVGTKYAMITMTHTGISLILRGYDGILYVTRADLPTAPAVQAGLTNPLYRLDTDAKDFTNYLTVTIPLDANRKFMTSVYRVGVTTSAELYLVGYIR